ncbi:MAG TPA: ABC transporter substrate-binding protein [Alphaproteobacteria bacterium]|jgi:branched-chain amino acid transport system substrate-binding protein
MKALVRLALAAVVVPAAATQVLADDPIKIGVLLPATGVFTIVGNEQMNALELGFDHFGRSVAGRNIELIREDSATNPATGLEKAKKLVLSDNVAVLTGIASSAVALAVGPYASSHKVPLLITVAGADALTGEKCSPYVLRVSFSNSSVARVMGPWAAEQGYKKVYMLAADYAAGREFLSAFKSGYVAKGGTIVGEAYSPFGQTKDWGPYLAKAKAADPDAIFVFYAGAEAINFIKQYAQFGLQDTIPLIGGGWLTSPLYVDAEGPAANGFIGSLNYTPGIETAENKAFQAAYQKRFGKVASEFAVQAYDAARFIVEALKKTGGKTDDKAALVKALQEVRFTGPRGPMRIDPATNNIVQNMYIFKVQHRDQGYDFKVLKTIENIQDPPNGCTLPQQ